MPRIPEATLLASPGRFGVTLPRNTVASGAPDRGIGDKRIADGAVIRLSSIRLSPIRRSVFGRDSAAARRAELPPRVGVLRAEAGQRQAFGCGRTQDSGVHPSLDLVRFDTCAR
jgi:hypothetical protein